MLMSYHASNPWSFIFSILRDFKGLICIQFFIASLWAIDLSLRPYILKLIIDKVGAIIPANAATALAGPIALYLGMAFFMVLVFRIFDFVWLKITPEIKKACGERLMAKMMDHSLNLLQSHFSGNIHNKIKEIMNGVPDLLKIFIGQFFANFLGLVLAIGAVWMVNNEFAVLLSAWVIIFVCGSVYFSYKSKTLCHNAAEVRSDLAGKMLDMLTNMINIHLFTARTAEEARLDKSLSKHVAAEKARDWWFLWMFAFKSISFVLYQMIGFVFLIRDFQEDMITAGDFALLITLNISIINSLTTMPPDILKFSEIISNITNGLTLILSPIAIQEAPDATPLKVTQGQIVFDSVDFQYEGGPPLFINKSVIIEPGSKVGLVGYSGSGKSTFINLVLRLYDVTRGRILIDNQDIRSLTLNSLRKAITVIPQDPALFHRSFFDNISYGCTDKTVEEIFAAAQKAYLDEFITTLRDGYDTLVGERGVKLSGGQRQRIAIARAILKDSPILILDEATSQLDSITEQEINDSLHTLMHNKTVLVIAHRLSTLANMDRLLVFEQGRIVEDGTHQDLLARNGLYTKIWTSQVGNMLNQQSFT